MSDAGIKMGFIGGETDEEIDLRPNLTLLACGTLTVAAISCLTLEWPFAIASTLLGGLMIYGADVDARSFLLPDIVTLGGFLCGLVVSGLLAFEDPWTACGMSLLRALCLALGLEIFRRTYARLRAQEGLGFGDVKLAAAIGAWLPLAEIPLCFALAAGSALVCVAFAVLQGRRPEITMKLPFGLFLCPALWLVYFLDLLSIRF